MRRQDSMTAMALAIILATALPASAQLGGALGSASEQIGGAAGKVDEAANAVGQASGAAAAAEGAAAAAPAPSTGSLTELLVQQLGVTTPQATGGAGAIFGLAKSKMSPENFSTVAAGVPDMDSLLAAAPSTGGEAGGMAGGLAGGLAGSGALGGLEGAAGGLGSVAGLASSFSGLGMSTDLVGQFIPVCVQYVQGSAGPEAASLLQAALQ
jgi:hypothetical protein